MMSLALYTFFLLLLLFILMYWFSIFFPKKDSGWNLMWLTGIIWLLWINHCGWRDGRLWLARTGSRAHPEPEVASHSHSRGLRRRRGEVFLEHRVHIGAGGGQQTIDRFIHVTPHSREWLAWWRLRKELNSSPACPTVKGTPLVMIPK